MHDEPTERDPGDINLRGVAWGGAMIVGGIALACAAAWVAHGALAPPHGFGGPNAAPRMRVDGPRLEAAPQPSKARYEAEKMRLLNSYGWVDRQAGIARIPVEQAMRLMAQRAAPADGRGGR